MRWSISRFQDIVRVSIVPNMVDREKEGGFALLIVEAEFPLKNGVFQGKD